MMELTAHQNKGRWLGVLKLQFASDDATTYSFTGLVRDDADQQPPLKSARDQADLLTCN